MLSRAARPERDFGLCGSRAPERRPYQQRSRLFAIDIVVVPNRKIGRPAVVEGPQIIPERIARLPGTALPRNFGDFVGRTSQLFLHRLADEFGERNALD